MTARHGEFLCWRSPPPLVVKINTYGTAKGNLGVGGAGCVLRDHSGKWLVAPAQNLRIATSVIAKLWGLFQGLQLPWERGYRIVILDVDSNIVIDLLKKERVRINPMVL